MNKWIIISVAALIICTVSMLYIVRLTSLPAITYFPIDKESSFVTAASSLQLSPPVEDNSNELMWVSESESDKKMYLRQDASILFENGRLKGIRSKWKQDTANIRIQESIKVEGSSLFQVISFHHGEVHHTDKEIRSLHQLSNDFLYVIDSPTTSIESFKSPANDYETEWKTLLDRTTKQDLLYHWYQLFNHFNISSDSYTAVPLTNLYRYNQEALPSLSQDKTAQIMGQLWEGLYKNYIIPIIDSEGKQISYVPIILFDKQNQHLLVLFELNGEKKQLIQRYGNDI
ncbi:hypothetical protein QGM71_01960 [Virgibacillus sp. C22-A2]|uniref:DUF3919 family protein n=1 Tax=Virgibacillus tibetensis TaxID=3042313 RepID=A0ABU6KCK4_9BACI|nr:hypothetical protein [Virgibacillus sp. C22-A2]